MVVVWSAEAVKSQRVRAEADIAREAGTLVQLSLDGAPLPMPFNRIQCADLAGWTGDLDAPGWKKVVASVAALAADSAPAPGPSRDRAPAPSAATPRRFSVGVLPFADPARASAGDDFAEGLVAEISTVLARFLVLSVTDAGAGARYVVEGVVRRSGTQARVNVQLREAQGARVWAERFDGDLADPFALQDDVAAAAAARIEAAILSHETQRLAMRPVDNLDAHELWLRARETVRRAGLEQGRGDPDRGLRAFRPDGRGPRGDRRLRSAAIRGVQDRRVGTETDRDDQGGPEARRLGRSVAHRRGDLANAGAGG